MLLIGNRLTISHASFLWNDPLRVNFQTYFLLPMGKFIFFTLTLSICRSPYWDKHIKMNLKRFTDSLQFFSAVFEINNKLSEKFARNRRKYYFMRRPP
jgi:hypothetical protein